MKTTPPLPNKELAELRELIQQALVTVEYDYRAAHQEILEKILANYIPKSHLEPLLEEESAPVSKLTDEMVIRNALKQQLRKELL